jgi:hypothetical protein
MNSERVSVALVNQRVELMRRCVLSPVVCPTIQYFFTLSRKWHDFRKKSIEHKMCGLIFSITLSETFFILIIIKQDIVKNVHSYLCKVHVILVRLQCNFNFPDIFSKNNQTSNLIKILPSGAELFHEKERTDWRTGGQAGMQAGGRADLIIAFAIIRKRLKFTHGADIAFKCFLYGSQNKV